MRKNLVLFIGVLSAISLQAQVYTMGNLGTISTCSGTFYDSGGSGGQYTNSQNFTATFCSANGQPMWFQFTSFDTEANFDYLRVYDGPSVASPQIGNYNGATGPNVIVSNNASNCLTFVFSSDGSVVRNGWAANIGCGTPPAPPPPASGTSCAAAQPFCSGTSYNFPAATGTTAEVGPDYGCLFTQPNPVWYYIQIDSPAGNLNLVLSNSANRDVDFAAWGPFTSPNGICGNLTANNIVDCSYSTAATEYIDIPNTTTGQFYMLCITNYSNAATNFTLNTSPTSQATTNCAILCNITNMTVTPTPCDPTNNYYSDTVRINVQYPPTSGYLVLTTSLGETDTIYPPYANTIVAVFDSLVSNGATVSLRARFSEDTSCTAVRTYLAPQCGCSATVTNTGPVCAGNSLTVTLDPTFASTNSALTYNWSGPNGFTYTATGNDTTVTINNAQILMSGTYTVTVSDSLCTATSTTNIVVNPQPTNYTTGVDILCYGGNTGSASANATPAGSVGYNWSNGATTQTINSLTAGTYYLTVTATGGCFVRDSVIITQPSTPFIIDSGQVTNIGCGGGNNGSIAAFASGGVSPYDFDWTLLSTSQTFTGQTISGIPAGNYLLVAADFNGCLDSANYQVSAPNSLSILSSTQQNVTCYAGADGSASIVVNGGSQPITYTWTNTASSSGSATNLAAGSYSVVVTDSAGCTATASYVITEPTQVTVSLVNQTNPTCNNTADGAITVQGAGGTTNPVGNFTYSWNNGQTGSAVSALVAGVYTVTVQDSSLCSVTASYTIQAPNAVRIDSVQSVNVDCFGANNGLLSAFASGGTGAITYTWLRLSDNQILNGQNITGLSPGSYLLTVSDLNNCSDSATYQIFEPTQLASQQSQVDVLCNGNSTGSATIFVQGGTTPYNFTWSNSAPNSSTASSLYAGNYTVTVTDTNGCIITANFTITEPPLLTLALVNSTNLTCFNSADGSLEVVATGGNTTISSPYNYLWNNNQTGAIINGLSAGTYTVTVTDANACQATNSFTITQPSQLVLNPTSENVKCFMGSDGSIDANPSGGTTPYTYTWNNQQSTQVISGLSAGVYRCTVTDFAGCTAIAAVNIDQPTDLQFTAVPVSISCPGDADGTITVTANGATPPYTFTIVSSTGNSESNFTGLFNALATGDYTVSVTDYNNCVKSTQINVPTPEPDAFSYLVDSTSCYGPNYNDGGAFVIATTIQNGPYQFSVDGGAYQYSGDFYNLSAGSHIISARNFNGCLTDIPVIIPEPLPIIVDVVPDTLILPLGNSGTVNTVYLNASNVSYNWNPSIGLSCEDCPNPTITVYQPTNYTVVVSTINGTATCFGTATLFVDVLPEDPEFIPNAITPNGDGNNDVFYVYGNDIKTVNLRIFNRWGEKVFDSNNQWLGWDGTYKGQPQNPGVFTYTADIIYLNEKQKQRVGSFILIR